LQKEVTRRRRELGLVAQLASDNDHRFQTQSLRG
jgi:hypothetical protein